MGLTMKANTSFVIKGLDSKSWTTMMIRFDFITVTEVGLI